jgi:hypothetical protein
VDATFMQLEVHERGIHIERSGRAGPRSRDKPKAG